LKQSLLKFKLNRAQSNIIRLGLALLVLQALFPPWQLTFKGGNFDPGPWSEGRAFLLKPPSPGLNAYQYHAALRMEVDVAQLAILLTASALWILTLCLVFRRRWDELDAGCFELVDRRKLLISLLVGVGAPLPLVGESVAYVVCQLAKEGIGFESGSVIVITIIEFFGLSLLSFLFLCFLRVIKSHRAKAVITTLAIGSLFASSTVGTILFRK
jgi:hypothetical protein